MYATVFIFVRLRRADSSFRAEPSKAVTLQSRTGIDSIGSPASFRLSVHSADFIFRKTTSLTLSLEG